MWRLLLMLHLPALAFASQPFVYNSNNQFGGITYNNDYPDYYDDSNFTMIYDEDGNINGKAILPVLAECQVKIDCPLENNLVPNADENVECQKYVDCYDLSEFPNNIPRDAFAIAIQDCRFPELNYENMKNFTGVADLMINFNDLVNVASGTFQAQRNLEHLRIIGNRLPEIWNNTFLGLDSLVTIDLSNNHIQRIGRDSFNHLASVVELSLNLNQIERLPDYAFSDMISLEILILQQNNISYISPYAFQNLAKLNTLNLKTNSLTSIPTRALKILPKLTTLFLGRNPIEIVSRSSLRSMTSLKYLWLEECRIKQIAKRAFNKKNLYTLVLEKNKLKKIPNIGRLRLLKTLILDGNPWVCDITALPMMMWLDQHGFSESSVLCAYPEYRRGRYLKEFSRWDLINNVGAPVPVPVTEPPTITDATPTTPNIIVTTTDFVITEKSATDAGYELKQSSTVSATEGLRKRTNSFASSPDNWTTENPPVTTQPSLPKLQYIDQNGLNFHRYNFTPSDESVTSSGEEPFTTSLTLVIDYNSAQGSDLNIAVSGTVRDNVFHFPTGRNNPPNDDDFDVEDDLDPNSDYVHLTKDQNNKVEEPFDVTAVVAVIVAMSLAAIAMIVFFIWIVRKRRLRQRRRIGHRDVEISLGAKEEAGFAADANSTNGYRLHRSRNGKRRRPDSGKPRENGVKSSNECSKNAKQGEYAECQGSTQTTCGNGDVSKV
ncbi:uncharacterized protein LOC143468114 [Clavelina lepadiformis]|uniref:uncharacterized protein LOC143468114 n=1 Tax=Clavelina lepadiformis TaxID=159417 RepID=UPI004042F749